MFSEIEKIQQLLNPRYKIIRKYPNPIGSVGDIIHVASYDTEFYDEYPYLFHKLKWWELRHQDDMPEYIRYEIHTVWFVEKLIVHGSLEEPYPYFTTQRHNHAIYYSNVDPQPATKEEYDLFQNTPQLLIPRYKVIKDYPTSRFVIGQLLFNPPKHLKLDDYPEFYQKLEWYEDLPPYDRPKYLIHTSTKEVKKVLKYHDKYKKRVYLTSAIPGMRNDWFTLSNQWEPATEQQFIEQKTFYENN